MDGESYFYCKQEQDPMNRDFYKSKDMSNHDVPREVAFTPWDKYPEKIMVWLTNSESGISEPFFMPREV